VNYLYFSENVQKEQLESKGRKVLRQIHAAKELREIIDRKRSFQNISGSIRILGWGYGKELNLLLCSSVKYCGPFDKNKHKTMRL